MAKVVLQDCANAVRSGTSPSSKSAFRTVRCPTVTEPGHGTTVPTSATPASTSAVAVAILNVEPGG